MAAGTPGATPFAGHEGPVRSVAFSPDGATLATGGEDGAARLWNLATGQRARQLAGHDDAVIAVPYSPDGTALATGSHDSTIQIWDTATGDQMMWVRHGKGGVGALAYSPDGTTLAAGSHDGTIRFCDPATGQWTREFPGHSSAVSAVAFSPDRSMLASGAGSARIWDLAEGRQVTRVTAHAHDIHDLSWSPDGSMLATAGGSVRVWETATWSQVAQLQGHGDFVGACAWSPDGASIASSTRDGTILLWETATWRRRKKLTGHTDTVRGLAWSPDSAALASVGYDGTIRIWDPRTGVQVRGTGFTSPRCLAGVRSDSPSGEDLLGIGDDVETLAELIAATETRPPLAIALIGDWGAGKSSVMLQMERHVGRLADRAQGAAGVSAFAANVRQVRFNAWHYSDDHLWTGIVSHLFEALAATPDDGDGEGNQGVDGDASDQRKIAARRDRLRTRLSEKRDARDRLARDLESAEEAPRPEGVLQWLGSPAYVGAILLAAIRQAFRDTRAALPAIAAWVVLGVAAYLAWLFLGTQIAGAATVIAALTPPAVAVARKLRAGHGAVLRVAEDQRSRLADRQRRYDQDIKDLGDRLVLIDAAARLDRFLDDRGGAGSYRGYQGLLGQVHADLRELSADLAQARRQWASDGGTGTPPLERIVLYIDDLDRCPPSRVVKVLDAVHLMLALDLFVVVVAVDARWLIRSLEYHHQELFRESGQDGETVATPVDYLDKIFQLPFALRPPAPDATAKYLRSLLPEPRREPEPALEPRASRPVRTAPAAPPRAAPPPGEPTSDESGTGGPGSGQSAPDEGGAVPAQPSSAPEHTHRPDGPRPRDLQLSQPEIEFMTRLGGLVPTPRAAKRLVNIYRLVRIGIPDAELPVFTGDANGGPYQTAQILLAILVGHPKAAKAIFTELLAAETPDDGLTTVIEKAAEADSSFLLIRDELTRLRREQSVILSAAECRRWCPLLARFSFYTRDLARL